MHCKLSLPLIPRAVADLFAVTYRTQLLPYLSSYNQSHAVQAELARCQRTEPCECLCTISSWCFNCSSSPLVPNTTSCPLRVGRQRKAVLLCCSLGWAHEVPCSPCSMCILLSPTHLLPFQNPCCRFIRIVGFVMLGFFSLFFFFLLKMYPCTCKLKGIMNFSLWGQTNVMLCALRVVALLTFCFPNNSWFSILLPFSLLLAICLQKQTGKPGK